MNPAMLPPFQAVPPFKMNSVDETTIKATPIEMSACEKHFTQTIAEHASIESVSTTFSKTWGFVLRIIYKGTVDKESIEDK
jgi:hypothetical protein